MEVVSSSSPTGQGSTGSGSEEEEWKPEGEVEASARSGSDEEECAEDEMKDKQAPKLTPQHHRLNSKGYIRLHGLVPDELCNQLRDAAVAIPKNKWKNLFGQGEMDPKRLFTKAPPTLMVELFGIIEQGCRTFFPDAEPHDWIFMKSLDGGKEQPAYRDFSPIPASQELYDYTLLPGSVIIGIEEGSYIYGYGWNRFVAMEVEKEKIPIGKGDVLIFRGDFIHGGGGYEKKNYRIHYFLDSRNSKRKVRQKNSINLILTVPVRQQINEHGPQKCFAWNCDSEFSSARAMRKHMRNDHGLYFNKYPATIKQPPRKRTSIALRARTLQPPDGDQSEDSVAPACAKKHRKPKQKRISRPAGNTSSSSSTECRVKVTKKKKRSGASK